MRNPIPSETAIRGKVHKSYPHDSAEKQVSGEAVYIDDISEPKDLLHLYVAQSTKAHANILDLDVEAVRR
ncbi:MAG: hypothetical protein JKY04_05265, partial [Sneathiella sp.]|nr:hypothetical protein [Sneathiella sp.]